MDAIKFCAKCGHELLEGANYCPFCGASVLDISDPVSRGAKYEHYEESDKSIEEKANWEGNIHSGSSSYTDSYPKEASSLMTCFKCGSTIPADSKFCPVCLVSLFVTCPKCGHIYSAQYSNCNNCGTNKINYLKQQMEEERQKKMLSPVILSAQYQYDSSYSAKTPITLSGNVKNVDSILLFGANKSHIYQLVKLKITGENTYCIGISSGQFTNLVTLLPWNQIIYLKIVFYGQNGQKAEKNYKVKVWNAVIGGGHYIESMSECSSPFLVA